VLFGLPQQTYIVKPTYTMRHLIGSVLVLLMIATAAEVVPANGTTASGTKLPSYVKVMLAFDGKQSAFAMSPSRGC